MTKDSFYRCTQEELHGAKDKERLKLNRKNIPVALLFMLLLGILASTYNIERVKSIPTTWTVDDDDPSADFSTIQEAVDAASPGDTVFVNEGTYCEHVFVNKSISLIGQDPFKTVIDGNASEYFPPLVVVDTTDVLIENLTVQNTTSFSENYGVSLYKTINVTTRNVIVTDAYFGVMVNNSTQCKIFDNKIRENHNSGIVFRGSSNNNLVVGNLISSNPTGIYIESGSEHNAFYRNNLIGNTIEYTIFPPHHTSWDNGAEGNYWDDYTGIDIDGDGVGETSLPHQGVDYYPLIEPWNQTRTYNVHSYQVVVNCNYTIASFVFNDTTNQTSFYITGPAGWSGFCNVTIPKGLLDPKPPSEEWIVVVGTSAVTYLNESVDDPTFLSFNYTLGASMQSNRVRIRAGVLYPPTANFEFTPEPASTIESVNFTDTSTNSPNGIIVWREWDFGDGQVVYDETFVSHQFLSKAFFNVTLTVGDNNSQTDSITRRVWVRNLSPSADFNFSPANPSVGLEVNFDASGSRDPDGSITEYRWNFGDNTVENTTSTTTSHKFGRVGAYNVTLTAIDDDGGEDKMTQIIPIGKGGTQIDIDVPTTVKVEEQITINATLLDEDSEPIAYKQITIQVYNDDLDLSRNVNTDDTGIATTTLSVNTTGEYAIKASYLGSSDYLASESTAALTVNPISTSLELQSPENTTQNKEVTISATLLDENEDPIYNATVEFHVYNGTAWELLGASQTNQSGIASFSHTPTHTGTFALKATYNGDGKHAASTSNEHNLTVAASETDYIPYVILVAIVASAATLLFILLRRRRS